MSNVIDIEANLPHEVCEVMCWTCGRRWIAAFPEATPLKDLECPCGKVGHVFKTGQTLDAGAAKGGTQMIEFIIIVAVILEIRRLIKYRKEWKK